MRKQWRGGGAPIRQRGTRNWRGNSGASLVWQEWRCGWRLKPSVTDIGERVGRDVAISLRFHTLFLLVCLPSPQGSPCRWQRTVLAALPNSFQLDWWRQLSWQREQIDGDDCTWPPWPWWSLRRRWAEGWDETDRAQGLLKRRLHGKFFPPLPWRDTKLGHHLGSLCRQTLRGRRQRWGLCMLCFGGQERWLAAALEEVIISHGQHCCVQW